MQIMWLNPTSFGTRAGRTVMLDIVKNVSCHVALPKCFSSSSKKVSKFRGFRTAVLHTEGLRLNL